MPENNATRRIGAGYGFAPGIAAIVACFLVAGAAALICHGVMDENYHPAAGFRDFGIFITDIFVFSIALFTAGIASLIAFAVSRRKKAALLSLVPACLGPLIVLGVYLLFRYGASWF